MSAIKVKKGDNIQLIVRQADTEVRAYLNGDEVYTHYGGADKKKSFLETTDIGARLQGGYNVLLVLGIRWMGNYLYDVEFQINGKQIAKFESLGSRNQVGNGIVWDFSVELYVEDELTAIRK